MTKSDTLYVVETVDKYGDSKLLRGYHDRAAAADAIASLEVLMEQLTLLFAQVDEHPLAHHQLSRRGGGAPYTFAVVEVPHG